MTITNQTDNNNMSGKGSSYAVPSAVAKRFNWGAFCLTWIWGLGNNTYITFLVFSTILIALIPMIGLVISFILSFGFPIWFGIKGNEWAWQNKHFDSVEAFHSYQKKWAIAGIIIYCLQIIVTSILIIAAMIVPTLMNNAAQM